MTSSGITSAWVVLALEYQSCTYTAVTCRCFEQNCEHVFPRRSIWRKASHEHQSSVSDRASKRASDSEAILDSDPPAAGDRTKAAVLTVGEGDPQKCGYRTSDCGSVERISQWYRKLCCHSTKSVSTSSEKQRASVGADDSWLGAATAC